MISLFRKIRKKLLTENRVTRYLAYAIGEIILVVIGILIALQINLWNEGQKQAKSRRQFTESLILELQKDSVFLKESINNLSNRIEMLQEIKDRINSPFASLDTLDFIMKYEYNPSFVNPIGLNKNTFSTLASSGQISLFNNQDAGQIQTYYQSALDIESFQIGQLDFYRDTFSEFLEKVPSADNMTQYPLLDPGNLKEQIWKGVNMEEARLQFGGITTLQNHIFLTFRNMDRELFDSNQKLIQHLRENSQ
ncbi:DUF6090 family protein [Algoriphagus sp. PAP.12]|uniref:DUF6090 family protein n=1 Tax=Algoriphagus sp. PAP.12 TaxID=2996678 RepID=UPI00227D6193|nr:DUF6090 family protein [Algoriphagus sp. PAP.12]